MGTRMNIYEKSPYENLGKELLEGGSWGWGITKELENCESVNKYYDECTSDNKENGCKWCECWDQAYTKVTYEQLINMDVEVLSKNTNVTSAFCLVRDNCTLEKQCDLDCLVDNHRECIWINFS